MLPGEKFRFSLVLDMMSAVWGLFCLDSEKD